MSLYLVRHASAGGRGAWPGPDHERPLDALGSAQATGLAANLAPNPITLILSSPALRCVETVAPLGVEMGLQIEVHLDLFEGAAPQDVMALLTSLMGVEAVLSSHGDVIPIALEDLSAAGCDLIVPGRKAIPCAKGSVWRIENDGTRFTSASYQRPINRYDGTLEPSV